MIRKALRWLKVIINRILYPNGSPKALRIGDVILHIDGLDEGGISYDSRKSYEELTSRLYPLIEEAIHPSHFIDIGANYGFISVIAACYYPQASILMVEPGGKLSRYIEKNMAANGVKNYTLFRAICGSEIKQEVTFAINPFSSQDNRVVAPKKNWGKEVVEMVTLDGLVAEMAADAGIFIKIDVQGFEEQVFRGGEKMLSQHSRWVIKSEFGPKWLKSQGADPKALLDYLIELYQVVELPGRISFNCRHLQELFAHPLRKEDSDAFLHYIASRDPDGTGWCDLLIRPYPGNLN